MYAREEDVFHAIYQQLKNYVREHFIPNSQYKQQMQELNIQITDLSQASNRSTSIQSAKEGRE